jgi:hypothetical protein
MSEASEPNVPESVLRHVREYAPELDPAEVAAFMAAHPLPVGESGSHVEWATAILRMRTENEFGDRGLSPDRVARELRRRDA